MALTVFTPIPPCVSFMDNADMMNFCGKMMMTDQDRVRCNTFFDEMTLDGRINALRETNRFKPWVPEEASHTLCIWLRDDFNGLYSPGKMIIDDSFLLANGAGTVLEEFRKSFNKEGRKMFEYVYSTTKDNTKLGDFLLLLRSTIEMQGYKPSQKTSFDNNVINIIDKRVSIN